MDFRLCQLRSLVMLAETLNYARAARALHMTQPTLSVQIKALEDSFGVKLFDRSRQGVSVTPAGQLLVSTARTMLRGLDTLNREMLQQVSEERLKLCCSQIGRYEVLPRLMRLMAERHPAVALEFLTLNPEDRVDALLSRRVDALIMVPAREWDGTEFYSMGRESLIAVVPERPPFTEMQSISIHEFAREQLLTVREREFAGATAINLTLMAEFGTAPVRILDGPLDHSAQMAIIAAGDAVTFGSQSSLAVGFPGTLKLPFEEEVLNIELGILVRKEVKNTSLYDLVNLLQEQPVTITERRRGDSHLLRYSDIPSIN